MCDKHNCLPWNTDSWAPTSVQGPNSPGPSCLGPNSAGPSCLGPNCPAPSCLGPICPGPSSLGPNCPGAQVSGAQLSGAQQSRAQLTVRGQIVRGPNCPGPSCPGPTVWGPIVWGPICQKPLEFVCVCVQIQKYSCCLCALLAGFKNELGLERNLFHSIRTFVPNNWDSKYRITEIQQLSLRPSGAV